MLKEEQADPRQLLGYTPAIRTHFVAPEIALVAAMIAAQVAAGLKRRTPLVSGGA